MVNTAPAQPEPLLGVIVYTAFRVPELTLFNVSDIFPAPAPAPPVNPTAYTAVQVNVLATPLLISFCGLKLYATSLQTRLLVLFAPTGSGLTGTVIVKLFPTHPFAPVGVTVNTAFNVPPVRLVSVPLIFPTPFAAPPVNPASYTAVHAKVFNSIPLLMRVCGS